MNTLKTRQSKTRKMEVVVDREFDGMAMSWIVQCNGSCECESGKHSITRTDKFSCDCPGSFYGHVCIHILAVWRFELSKIGKHPSFWFTIEQALKQHRKVFQIESQKRNVFVTIRGV